MRRITSTMLATGLAALAASAVAAPIAGAAADRSGVVAAGAPYAWDGIEAQGFNVLYDSTTGDICGKSADSYCDETLLELKGKGTLKVTATEFGFPLSDFDLSVYASDSTGKLGKEIKSHGADPGSEELVEIANSSGWVLARVVYFLVPIPSSFKGKAEFTSGGDPPGGATPPPPPAGGGGPPPPPAAKDTTAPDSAIAKVARSAKASSMKGWKGSASDDKGVKLVEIALVRKDGKKCKSLGSNGKLKKSSCKPATWLAAKGTTKWTFKLKRKLESGRYSLYSRATDTAGNVENGFGSADGNYKTFKIKGSKKKK